MSRVKTLLVAIILVVGILFPTTTLASPGTTVSITDAILPTGATGSVALSISGAAVPVSGVDVDVSYDPAVVEVTDASASDFDSLVSNIENDHTHLVGFVTSQTGLTGTIKVADITLTRLGGESALTLNVVTLKDDDGNPIPFTLVNGLVTGAPTGTVVSITNATLATGATGSVALSISGAAVPVSSVDVDVSYDPAVVEVTDASGSDFNSLTSNIENGHTRLVAFVTSETGLTGTIKVADITLMRLGGESALTLDVTTLKDDDGNPIPFTVVNGLVAPVAPAPAGGGGGGAPVAPRISDVGLCPAGVTETTADICWTTNKVCTSQVEYWASPTMLSPLDKTMVYSHLVHLTGLTPGSTYHYKTMSKDASGNLAVSDEYSFTTLGEAPAAIFTTSDLSVSPGEVNIGEPVTISVLITNTGDDSGSYKVTVKINGVVEATKEVTLDAGASKEATFTTAKDVAGSYSVDVNGLGGSFTVREKVAPAPAPLPIPPPAPPTAPEEVNWPLLGGLIAAAVVLLGVVIFWVRRRRAY